MQRSVTLDIMGQQAIEYAEHLSPITLPRDERQSVAFLASSSEGLEILNYLAFCVFRRMANSGKVSDRLLEVLRNG